MKAAALSLALLAGCLQGADSGPVGEGGCVPTLFLTRMREGSDVVYYLERALAEVRVEEARYMISNNSATEAEGIVAELGLPKRTPRLHDNGTRRVLDAGDHIVHSTDGLPDLTLTTLAGKYLGGTIPCG